MALEVVVLRREGMHLARSVLMYCCIEEGDA